MKNKLVLIPTVSLLFTFVSCGPKVVGFNIIKPKTKYLVSEKFEAPKVEAKFSDGEVKDVSKEVTFSDYNLSKVGEYEVKVTYKKYVETYTIKVDTLLYDIDDKYIIQDENCNKVKAKYTYEDYSNNNAFEISSVPSIGEANLLVIPIWFTDSSNYIDEDKKELVREDIETAYFGSESDTGWESVGTYYNKDSFGRLDYKGVVSPWYEIDKSSEYYYSSNNGARRTSQLVSSAVEWYKELSGSNLTEFDVNKDGYIDSVILIYGSPDNMAMENWEADNMWAYCSWIQDSRKQSKKNPGANAFCWASYDFMYGYEEALERTGHSYNYGDCSSCNLDTHTYIHEMGHLFGLPDYYDYTGQYAYSGIFSMQDENIGAHDPFSRFALGWSDPYIPTKTTTIEVNPMEVDGSCILLASEFTGSPFTEYILLELFTPDGLNELDCYQAYKFRPSGPVTSGVRIWHVDARLAAFNVQYDDWTITDDASKNRVYSATSNSSPSEETGYYDFAGSTDYKTLQLIRNDKNSSWKNSSPLSEGDLFYEGDTFSISDYRNQFPNKTYFNSGHYFPWTVAFDEVGQYGMTVTCTFNG